LLLLSFLCHAIIDLIKFFISGLQIILNEVVYAADQLLHLMVIIFLSEFIFSFNFSSNLISIDVLKWFLLMLTITKPANMTFKMLFQKYHLPTDDKTIPGAGAIIGNLERVLSVILLGMNQMTAIGFIYTAKSIARFKEIEQSKGFAEYYLFGTLFSILYVVMAYLLIIFL